jgi:hypothetical protein
MREEITERFWLLLRDLSTTLDRFLSNLALLLFVHHLHLLLHHHQLLQVHVIECLTRLTLKIQNRVFLDDVEQRHRVPVHVPCQLMPCECAIDPIFSSKSR